jgi:hypothetical protein
MESQESEYYNRESRRKLFKNRKMLGVPKNITWQDFNSDFVKKQPIINVGKWAKKHGATQ